MDYSENNHTFIITARFRGLCHTSGMYCTRKAQKEARLWLTPKHSNIGIINLWTLFSEQTWTRSMWHWKRTWRKILSSPCGNDSMRKAAIKWQLFLIRIVLRFQIGEGLNMYSLVIVPSFLLNLRVGCPFFLGFDMHLGHLPRMRPASWTCP